MRFVLDGARIPDRAALHRALAEGLRFPEWYGGNLDALHDCRWRRRWGAMRGRFGARLRTARRKMKICALAFGKRMDRLY